MTKVRTWTYALSALMTAFAVVMIGPTAAQAAPDTTCTNLNAGGTNWGGTYFCNYGHEEGLLQNGDYQVWVIAGAGHNIFTRWQKPNGSMSAWFNMGGNVKSNGTSSYLQHIQWIRGANRTDEIIKVIGTDGEYYCNIRSGVANSWNGWTRAHCDVP